MKPEPYDQLRDDRADLDEENQPDPGEPACYECGDLAEYPVEFPHYCRMCWNGQQRRRSAGRHALST
jgi:hypothetical protein